MTSLPIQSIQKKTLISIFVDLSALALIYMVPTISHLISLPVYLIEPMRLMLILALVHTNKANAIILALSMPLFSFLISGHPVFPKMVLITFELLLNVLLFYGLVKKMKHVLPSILLSIVLSKITYYIIKFGLIKLSIIDTGLISTPIFIQVIMTFIFSVYLFKFYKEK